MGTNSNLIRLSNSEDVDISSLSVEDLRRIHYEEECWVAEKLMTLEPFSQERIDLLHKGYEIIRPIMHEIACKQGNRKISLGADRSSARMLVRLVNEKRKHDNVLVYEAGVGTGFSIGEVAKHCADYGGSTDLGMGLSIRGCDVFLLTNALKIAEEYPDIDIDLEEGHVFECIQRLPDDSIDVFYADNVFEHFLPDEAEQIYKEIANKLKPDAYVFLVIPNKYLGPSDISMYFNPFGSKAKGFHFMEMSYRDITNSMKEYGIYQSHFVFHIPKIGMFSVKSDILLKIKFMLEPIIAKIPGRALRNKAFSMLKYSYSIMKSGK